MSSTWPYQEAPDLVPRTYISYSPCQTLDCTTVKKVFYFQCCVIFSVSFLHVPWKLVFKGVADTCKHYIISPNLSPHHMSCAHKNILSVSLLKIITKQKIRNINKICLQVHMRRQNLRKIVKNCFPPLISRQITDK